LREILITPYNQRSREPMPLKKLTSKTLAIAESCTGGLLGKRLTDIPGSSRYFLGGIIAYSNAVKSRLLGVPAKLLNDPKIGAVSRQAALCMAKNVRKKFGADFGISITGIAGPGRESKKPAGLVYIAVASATRARVKK